MSENVTNAEFQAEGALLSNMLLSREITRELSELIDDSYFYFTKNKILFQACISSIVEYDAIDPALVAGLISAENKEKCSDYYIAQVSDVILTPDNHKHYLKQVVEAKVNRLIKEKGQLMMQAIEEGCGIDEKLQQLEDSIQECRDTLAIVDGGDITDQTLAPDITKLLEQSAENGGKLKPTRHDCGIIGLDEKGLLEKGEVTIMAGRPGMGKSSVALAVASSLIRLSNRVLYIFHESTKDKLILKILCQINNCNEKYAQDNFLDLITSNNAQFIRNPNFIIAPGLTDLPVLKRKIRELKTRDLCPDVIIIDQITKMTNSEAKTNLRTYEIESINNYLEIAARGDKKDGSDKIAVLGLAQLNRKCEERDVPLPTLEDLRDSGSFEQSASTVVFLYRPEYYIETKMKKKEFAKSLESYENRFGSDPDAKGLLLASFAKCRYDSVGLVPLRFSLPGTGVRDWDNYGTQVREYNQEGMKV